MTTPKTLSKEPLTDEEFRNAERDLDRAVNPDDCVVWTAAYGEMLISELKRLRQEEPTEVKILRDAIDYVIDSMNSIPNDSEEIAHKAFIMTLKYEIEQADKVKRMSEEGITAEDIAETNFHYPGHEPTVVKADEVKNGSSEEDRELINHMEDILEHGVGKGSQRVRHVLSKLKQYMGIE